MSQQLALDAPLRALARATDPATSHAAAAHVTRRLQELQVRVVAELRISGPATSHELAAALGVDLVSISPRMKPLELAGYVMREGKRKGRTVWRAT